MWGVVDGSPPQPRRPRREGGTVRDEGRRRPAGLVGGREAAPAAAGAVRTSLS